MLGCRGKFVFVIGDRWLVIRVKGEGLGGGSKVWGVMV